MKKLLDNNPVATIIVVVAAVAGAVVVVTEPATLSFSEYLEKMGVFAGGVGVLGIGRSMLNKG